MLNATGATVESPRSWECIVPGGAPSLQSPQTRKGWVGRVLADLPKADVNREAKAAKTELADADGWLLAERKRLGIGHGVALPVAARVALFPALTEAELMRGYAGRVG